MADFSDNTKNTSEGTYNHSAPASTKNILVGPLSEFPPGKRKVVRTPNDAILLLNVDGELFALSNFCPHAGGYLQYGPLEGYILECPLHYWPFDIRTGCLVGMNQSSLLDEVLPVYSVLVIDELIYIQL
jgi:nitrite reductase/ring-hydroxylating ferredoxin subunit